MCNLACLDFARTHLAAPEVAGKTVIEVGALDVNGSLRSIVEALGPAEYLGVDVKAGPGVDTLCDIGRLTERFGRERFDLLVATEVLEHVRHWRRAVHQMKAMLRPGGVLLVTTRSPGFPYHGYPFDFWRYTPTDLAQAFADLTIEALEDDPLAPGVFLKARKPATFTECDLRDLHLHSVITRRSEATVGLASCAVFAAGHALRAVARRVLGRRSPPV